MNLANTGEVGPRSRDLESVVWWWGEIGLFLGSYRGFFLGKMPCWDGISPKKRQAKGRGHLMHAIGVSRERAFNSYPFG